MDRNRRRIYLLFISFIFSVFLIAQEHDEPKEIHKFRVMFYNVENLFDVFDDPEKNDDEFLPKGARRWDNKKFYKKLNSVYRVIISVGGWTPPGIVGLCEVENRFVLQQLVIKTPLNKFDYRIIHFDSPDNRGIDVAMLYRQSFFTPDTSFVIPLIFPFDPQRGTRDILYVKGRAGNDDTLHFFINHWPSRYGGYLETKPKRDFAAGILKHYVDSLILMNADCRIIIMGDFNDNPNDESISGVLAAHSVFNSETEDMALINLMYPMVGGNQTGTLKFRENWDVFDQIIVTFNLLNNHADTRIDPPAAFIFSADFLLESDTRYGGMKPFRTYSGFKYQGGYSDHLPVYLDLKIQSP